MKLEEYRGNEMHLLYDALSQKGVSHKEEIVKAIEQKNTLNRHIFDVFDTRGVIRYGDIAQAVKEIVSDIEDGKREVLLDKTSVDVNVSEKAFYIINEEGEEIEVELSFMVYARDLEKPDKPIVIVPKDSFNHFQIRKRHLESGENRDQDFTLYDIVKEAVTLGVSDIHFNYGNDLYYVFFRIDSRGVRQDQYTMNMSKAFDFFNQVRQKMALDTKQGFKASEYRLPQGGTIKYDELGVDLRGQFSPSGRDDRNKFVCRILKKPTGRLGTINDLKGYDPHFIEMLKMATKYQKGLMLVTGVTNSGKSTLTSHFINSISDDRMISTFEDPIEYDKTRPNTTQHQVFLSDDDNISVDFLDFVKSAKRQDLDVAEIGEIRKGKNGKNDLMEAVVEGVKAGNFTISTTHIDSAFDVPLALVNMYGVDRYVVADLLVFVVTQNLVEKICPHCRLEDEERQNNKVLKEWRDRGDIKYAWTKDLDQFLEKEEKAYIRNPNGCPHCKFTGTKGLVPIYEYYKPDVKMIMWLNEHLDHINKFDVEKEFCSLENPYLAKNMLSCFVDKMRNGEIDAHENIIGRALMS